MASVHHLPERWNTDGHNPDEKKPRWDKIWRDIIRMRRNIVNTKSVCDKNKNNVDEHFVNADMNEWAEVGLHGG